MVEIIVGLAAVAVGLLFCFAGAPLMRIVITVWGAFAGFGLGAGLIAGITGDHLLATALGWAVGLVVAVIVAALAYLYYSIAVIVAMSSVGFALGGAVMAAIGVTWSWAIVLIAALLGLVFALVAIVADLPLALLQVLSAMGGAAVAVAGLMLLVGSIDVERFADGGYLTIVREDWWWWLVYLVTAVLGVLAQGRAAQARRESLRRQWQAGSTPGP